MERTAKLLKVGSGWEVQIFLGNMQIASIAVSDDKPSASAITLVIAQTWIEQSKILQCFESEIFTSDKSMSAGQHTFSECSQRKVC